MSQPTFSVAILTSSIRTPRINPHITAYLISLLTPLLPANTTLTHLDLLSFPLPLSTDEPIIPAQIPLPLTSVPYQTPATNAWSAEVQKHHAFIFVTPQYNWGYPAALKNAIDHLYFEWAKKPAMVVSYGGHGGRRAGEQLAQVLAGVKMVVSEKRVALAFMKEGGLKDAVGGQLSERQIEAWQANEPEIKEAWAAFVELF